MADERKFLKCTLTYLCCSKYNEIVICHLNVQNHVSQGHTYISDILWAMLGKGRKYVFHYVSWFVSIILNFNAFCDAYTV